MNIHTKSLIIAAAAVFSSELLAGQTIKPETTSFLPETVWAAPRVENNIFFDNLLLSNSEIYFWDVTCAKGRQMQSRWTFEPSEEDSGMFSLELTAFDIDDERVISDTTTIRVANGKAGAGQSISALVVGDSLTAGGLYTRELLKMLDGQDEPTLRLFGSQGGEGSNRHEGYPGWTWRRFLSVDSANSQKSPFIFNGKLDFPEYLKTHCEGNTPDFILIFLGVNDVFGLTDLNRTETISNVLDDAEKLIGAFRAGADKAKIGVVIPLPPASQDGFGTNYGCGQTRRGYFKNIKHYSLEMQRRLGGREKDGIYLIPAYLGFDSKHGYPAEQQLANARSDVKALRQTNAVHPAVQGYRQVADAIYSWLKNML